MTLGRAGLPAEAVRCPVLCVSGSRDRLIPKSAYRKLAPRYSADEIVIPGRGHWLLAGSLVPTVAKRVLAWIKGLPDREGRPR